MQNGGEPFWLLMNDKNPNETNIWTSHWRPSS